MLRRKFYDTLLKWSKEKNQECLLVRGARQIGKTYIIDYFGKNNYKSYIYLNFIENPQLKKFIISRRNIFENDIGDASYTIY